MKPDLFDFIDKHNLHDGIREKVLFLLYDQVNYVSRQVYFAGKFKPSIKAWTIICSILDLAF